MTGVERVIAQAETALTVAEHPHSVRTQVAGDVARQMVDRYGWTEHRAGELGDAIVDAWLARHSYAADLDRAAARVRIHHAPDLARTARRLVLASDVGLIEIVEVTA